MHYYQLDTRAARREVRKIGINLARYLHNNEIKNIIFADNSARPGYIALRGAWKENFPNEPTPHIYFTNPNGYSINKRNINEIVREFDKIYPKLSLDKSAKIMLFDVCMHTGNTLRPILEVLNKAGYHNISVGLAQPEDEDYSSGIDVDFIALGFCPEEGCYPFTRELLLEKDNLGILSSLTTNQSNRIRAIQVRKEISSLFR